MKKLFLFLFMAAVGLAFSVSAGAQVAGRVPLVSSYGNSLDTLTNATTQYLTLPHPINHYRKVVNVQLNSTSISGTLAGTATLQYSTDSVGWFGHNADSTFTLSSSQTSVGWIVHDYGEAYVRIKVVGSGTQSTSLAGYFVGYIEQGGL